MLHRLIPTAIAITASAGLAQDWASPVTSNWNSILNWTPQSVPNSAAATATLGLGGAYEVNYDLTGTVGTLNIPNPDVTLNILVARDFEIVTLIDNDGRIRVNPTNAAAATAILFADGASIMGTGEISLDGISTRAVLGRTTPGNVVGHGADHTVRGFGRIECALDTFGTILADVPGQTLDLVLDDKSNHALIASAGGILEVDGVQITQTAAGVIDAQSGEVRYNGATIVGGRTDASGGTAAVFGNSTFQGVQNDGDLAINSSRILNVVDGLTNNARIDVNPTNGAAQTRLHYMNSGDLDGTGEVVLGGFSTRAVISGEPGVIVTLAPTQAVRGFGRIEAESILDGPVTADVAAASLDLVTNDKTNNNVMSAQNDGILIIDAITITQGGGASIEATDGEVQFRNCTIVGGSVRQTAGTAVVFASSAFDGVASEGTLTINGSRDLSVTNGLVNDGSILVNPTNAAAQTSMIFNDSTTLSGTGEVVLSGLSTRAQIETAPGETMTIEAGQTVRGFGRLEASAVLQGPVMADVTGQTLSLTTEDKTSTAVLSAVAGGILEIDGVAIDQTGGGMIDAVDGEVRFANATIVGGKVTTSGGASTIFSTSTFDGVTNTGSLVVNGSRDLEVRNGLVNDGEIVVNPTNGAANTDVYMLEDGTISGTGTIRLVGSSIRAGLAGEPDVVLTNGPTHTITGIGVVETELVNQGTIAPGLSVGTMTASAPISFTSTATYDCEVNGDESADVLDSNSTIELAGDLSITGIDGFDASGTPWAATIMVADNGVTGQFDTINGLDPLDPSHGFSVGYLGTEVRVARTCRADVDLNLELDIFDILAFLGFFDGQTPAGDWNGDGIYDIFDVLAYLGDFEAGC